MKIAIHDKKHKFIKLESLINIRENKKMKQKRRWKELLKNNLVSVILLIIVISIIAVFAGDIFVDLPEGKIEAKNLNVTGNVTASYFIGNGSLLTDVGGGNGGNPFDQSLNTTDAVQFKNITIMDVIKSLDSQAKIYFENGYLVVEG